MTSLVQGLYAIADNTFRPEYSHAQLVEEFLKGAAKIVQFRFKNEDLRFKNEDLRTQAEKIMELKKQYPFTFIINDHVNLALQVGADGVHVGKDDLPISEVRRKVGQNKLIGYSSHSLREALEAQAAGADYVAFGAIFSTKTKGAGHPVQGLEKLEEVVEALRIPVVAIGGIGPDNFQKVRETKVAAIAMITALTEAQNIAQTTRFFTSQFS